MFCLLGVVFWVHRYPQPLQHLIVGLEGSAGCYYQLHEGLYLFIDQKYAVIALRDQIFLCRGRCILYSCP